MAEQKALVSVGSRGDSYDNALAESTIGLFKAELVRHLGPWRGIDDLERAMLEWVDWYNHRRLHSAIGMIPPVEAEQLFHSQSVDRRGRVAPAEAGRPALRQGAPAGLGGEVVPT